MAINNPDTPPESNPHKPQQNLHHHQPMDDAASEKLHSLKSLNALLVKETVERRQQVDSLVQSNTYLESEVNRSVMEKDSLQAEMNAMAEKAVALEIERGLAVVFMTAQVNRLAEERRETEKWNREKELEIAELNRRLEQLLIQIDEQRGVETERDEIRVLLDARIRQVNELLLKVTKAEENEARVLTEVGELKGKCDGLMVENAACEKRIESKMREKEDLRMSLVERNGVVDELRWDIARLVEEKSAIADEKNAQDGRNTELQVKVDELKKLVEGLRAEERELIEKIAVLQEKYVESSRNEVEMKMEINVLVEEKKESERRVERLGEEKGLVAKDLEDVVKELEQQKLSLERVVEEKTDLESAKMQRESEIVRMNEELHAFKDMVSSLEKTCVGQIEKVKELEVEAGSYKFSLDQAEMERDEALKQLDKEKTITADFKQAVAGMEKEMEGLNEKLATFTCENGKHLGEKKLLEDRCAGLVKEVADLEAKFAESRMEFDGKVGAAEANSNRVLNILKRTVMVCDGNNDDGDQENGVEEGIKEHVAGIEAIKRAFKDKESRLEELKMQLELVKSSAAEARKEKSFWTMVSSATTLIAAAASLAFVAKAH
ncbi:hypothetical protein L1987_46553 [Smallanthus sonchifolius]|uniref:Uncharacterized protein n=1 Tax=Smallanthus sonchifolius TaxID=185202 RepID=A0ACB9G042_9ASTR|nr:hypothetical protein L1987_46553 [Smallanthus sonchifolius]